jgi:hypothetical protein
MEAQETVNKVHEAFEATRLAVAGGDLTAAILGVTFGSNEATAIWYEQAGNYCVVNEMCRHFDEGKKTPLRAFASFPLFEEMVKNKDLLAAVMLYSKHDEIFGVGAGLVSATKWLVHEAALRQDTMVKISFQMNLQRSMMANQPRVQPAGGMPGPNGGRINLN